MSKIFDQIADESPMYVRYFVDSSFEIADRIQALLLEKGMQQKDFAKAIGKQESEISKWLSGTHNFTLKTIAKIKEVLGDQIIQVVNGQEWNQMLHIPSSTWGDDIENYDFEEEMTEEELFDFLDRIEKLEQENDVEDALIIQMPLVA